LLGYTGWTPLHCAAWKGHQAAVRQILLAKEIDIDAEEDQDAILILQWVALVQRPLTIRELAIIQVLNQEKGYSRSPY
jgi:ankyrin repeat protein